MKTRAEILSILSEYKSRYAAKYGIERLGLFGSVARGEQREDSDVDVAYTGEPNLLLRSRMKRELEAMLGCRVDLVRLRRKAQDAAFEDNLLKDLYLIP